MSAETGLASAGRLNRLASFVLGAAAFALAVSCCLPWSHIVLLHTIGVSVPGLFFQSGSYCFAAAVGILLVLRRSPLLCLPVSLLMREWLATAAIETPRIVKHQVIGVQLSLFPINRMLDQFHLPNIEFADSAQPDANLLSPALSWAATAALALLILSCLTLPCDPAIQWVARRVRPPRCPTCGTTAEPDRKGYFCRQCGSLLNPRRLPPCPRCETLPRRGDRHCIRCGAALATGYPLGGGTGW